jgi:hypothetical protein
METYKEIKEYAEDKKLNLRSGDFRYIVEVEFVDAEMEIRWAFVEKKGNFVIVFAEHYPPLIQHVDETDWFRQKDFDGNVEKEWKNENYNHNFESYK